QDYGDKVPADVREAVTKANDEVKEALKGDDVERIKSTTDALMQAFQRIGEAMYSQQAAAQSEAQAAAGGGGNPAGGSNDASSPEADGDVVEGEIVDEGGSS